MSRDYCAYVKRCRQLKITPKPEFADIHINSTGWKVISIIFVVLFSILAHALAAISRPSGGQRGER